MEPYYYCYLAKQDGSEVFELPLTPAELPTRKLSADSEDFLTVGKGYRVIIGDRQPWEAEPEFVLPAAGRKMQYALSQKKGHELKRLLLWAMNKKKPLKYMIAAKSGKYYMNNLVQITSFEYYVDKKRFYHISFTVKEWVKY
jgi:hypothetical protein